MDASIQPVLRRLASVSLLVLVALATACGGRAPTPFSGFRGGQADEIRIVVDNQSFLDIRVFSTGSRGRQPVGVVDGNSQETFTITWRTAGDISFVLEEIGGRRDYPTNQLSVSPGERIDLVIPDNVANAYIRARR